MSTGENKARAHRLFDEGFNRRNTTVVDEIIAPGYIDHSAMPAPAPGPEGFRRRMAMLHAALDPEMAFGDFLAEGELVAFSWTISGTHQGVFAGVPPTGRKVTVSGVNIERFENGKIVEHWSQFDMAGLLRQLGALPASG
jgi:steroid delta-isomerase-like uncharacterized protein